MAPRLRSHARVVSSLPSGPGFSFDLSESREDPLARRACEHVFGQEVVDGAMSRLHRAQLSYDALVSDLLTYEQKHAPSGPTRSDPVYRMAVQSVRDDLACKELLIPWTLGATTKLGDFPKSKSPGLPWKLEGYRTKGDVVAKPENVLEINKKWQLIGAGIPQRLEDVCLFARTQVCKPEKNKIRSVWGYPLEVYMEEARFFYPLMDRLKAHKEHSLPIAYGLEMTNGGMKAVADMCLRSGEGSKFVMTDWSLFDKTTPPWLVRDAFQLLSELFDWDHVRDVEGKIWRVRGYRSLRRWKKLVDYFIETPVRTCKGERFMVRGGVPSGSCFTNIVDTVINTIVSRYLSYHTVGYFPRAEIYLGDDGVLVFPHDAKVNLDSMAKLAAEMFGMVLSPDKSYLTSNIENVHFLGYYCKSVGVPHRDQDLLIVSFIHPERSRRTAEECAAAALGQLWANFDPWIAGKWYKVLMYCCDAFKLAPDDVLVHLKNHLHRHKYLSHVGREAAALTVPYPGVLDEILEVLPRPTPRFIPPIRNYDYSDLWKRTLSAWQQEVPPEVETDGDGTEGFIDDPGDAR